MVKSIHTKENAYFVERLRKAREEAGLTQIKVAKKMAFATSKRLKNLH